MSPNLFDVQDQCVVITGVAGQLGDQYARAFLERGARVIGLDLALATHTAELQGTYPDAFRFHETDVTNRAQLSTVLKAIQTDFGVPSVLINNAALDSPPSAPPEENGRFEDYPEASWDKVMDVNLKGVYLCCQVIGGAMALAKRGSIVNIASIYGVVSPDQNLYEYRRQRGEIFFKPVAYAASKSGILNLTRYLATYWAKQNVRVNTLTIAGVYNGQEKAFLQAYTSRIPVGRMARVDEYNGAVIFLASKASEYMTGHNLIVDGGWTAI